MSNLNVLDMYWSLFYKRIFCFLPCHFVLLEAVSESNTFNVNMHKFVNILIKILKLILPSFL